MNFYIDLQLISKTTWSLYMELKFFNTFLRRVKIYCSINVLYYFFALFMSNLNTWVLYKYKQCILYKTKKIHLTQKAVLSVKVWPVSCKRSLNEEKLYSDIIA